MLKLTVIDISSPLIREKLMSSRFATFKPEIRKQLSRLTALLKQEAVSKILVRDLKKDPIVQWKKSKVCTSLLYQLLTAHSAADRTVTAESWFLDEAGEVTEDLETAMVHLAGQLSLLL
jgi:branched-subunit amino acid aminotransferase/4-amino-4-deoxychorismate lyase